MKPVLMIALAGGAMWLASCATEPIQVYGPANTQAGTSASAAVSLDGKIADCGHAGAAPAVLDFPEGWQARLGEVAEKQISNDELLGGPVTTEVVARNAQPINPPVPTYPQAAASAGLEASCAAMFDVNKDGRPEEILTACSSPIFNTSAFAATETLRFSPKVVDGRRVRQLNVVYPYMYCLDG